MVKKIFGMKIKNEQERLESQSGGAFYCLARKVILEGGVVYGVVLNEKVVAEYARATTLDELIPMKGSKYVQVNMGNTLENVCEDLKKGKKVFFSGTPCCVAGLLSFLKQVKADTVHLITCDIVCHGVASPLIFRKFIQFVSKDNVREIKDFKFRDKSKGWHSHFETYYFRGKQYCTNNYARLFSSGNCLRESCYECQYANYNRVADITIGDFWGIEKYYPELDDNKGNSLLMFNSDKGLPLFESVKKDIIFWLFLFVTIGASIFALFRIAESGDGTNLYNYINEYLIYIGLFMSMFISIFVGKEYSEGIIRNKIIMRS